MGRFALTDPIVARRTLHPTPRGPVAAHSRRPSPPTTGETALVFLGSGVPAGGLIQLKDRTSIASLISVALRVEAHRDR